MEIGSARFFQVSFSEHAWRKDIRRFRSMVGERSSVEVGAVRCSKLTFSNAVSEEGRLWNTGAIKCFQPTLLDTF